MNSFNKPSVSSVLWQESYLVSEILCYLRNGTFPQAARPHGREGQTHGQLQSSVAHIMIETCLRAWPREFFSSGRIYFVSVCEILH